MTSNLERYSKDLEALIKTGELLKMAFIAEYMPEQFEELLDAISKAEKSPKAELSEVKVKFSEKYQLWYSESYEVMKQLLPSRLVDFIRYYERPKTRKEITFSSYTIEDCLRDITVMQYGREIVAPSSAYRLFEQQLNILKSVKQRFKSSLFQIKELVQADLFDSELEAARSLIKNKFSRAAGVMAGVVLEKHLSQVATAHALKQNKKHPAINDWNELLKANDVIDVPTWRAIQRLGDLRNLCGHDKQQEPSVEQAQDLVDGVDKIIKSVH